MPLTNCKFTTEVINELTLLALKITHTITEHYTSISVSHKLTLMLFSYQQLRNPYNTTTTELTNTLCIYEDQWHTHKAVLLSRIQSLLGNNEIMYARHCKIVKINSVDAINFLNKNHLLGGVSTAVYYALVHQNQLVAVAAFSHGRAMRRLPNNKLGYELVAYASIIDVNVVGGLSRLIAQFITDYSPGDIMTYADATFTNSANNVFLKLGFTFHSQSPALTFIITTNTHSRIKAKSNIYNLAAHELVYTNNGNAKFVLNTL